MRNVIAHVYEGVDLDQVRDAVLNRLVDLDDFVAEIRALIAHTHPL